MPPEIITTIVWSLTSILLFNKAAAATAPPGSTTIFKFSASSTIVCLTSSSLTVNPPDRFCLFIAKVTSPGCSAKSASQIEYDNFLLGVILLLIKEIWVSLKFSGSTLKFYSYD